ncbi:VOC family protein [Streptomyces sp. NPDC048483]|uniref:VOC family protein n=1 Tax=Streptomyces sp. NPDC048483 TaxID=3154927 RepID=UPI003447707C
MTIRRVNHLVLSVTDIEASTRFYVDVLGLKVVDRIPRTGPGPSAFMVFLRSSAESTNHHDLGLLATASAAARPADGTPPGLVHASFEVGTVDELAAIKGKLESAGSVRQCLDQGAHLSVYAVDPDGIELELIWRLPDGAWSYDTEIERKPLDLETARERWGGDLVTGAAAGIPA